MGFNISGFRANGPVLGLARPSNFQITLTFPNLVDTTGLGQKVTMMARASKLPESIVQNMPVPYFGRTIQLAGNRQFEDWDVTIMNDEDFLIRNAFIAWHNSINTIISNRLDPAVAAITPASGDSYKTTGFITQLAKTGPGASDGPGAIATYLFEGMFPTLVSDIPVDWDATNQFEQFTVRFAYDWYEPYIAAGGAPIVPLELSDDS